MNTRQSNNNWLPWLVGGSAAAVAYAFWRSSQPPPPVMPPLASHLPTPREAELIRFVESATGTVAQLMEVACPPVECYRGTDRNAWSDGTRIGVELTWLDRELSVACNDLVCDVMEIHGVIGHEMGHHALRHATMDFDRNECPTNHRVELQADHVAGWVYCRLGAPIVDPYRILTRTSPHACSHPDGPLRRDAFLRGYQAAMSGLHWRQITA